MGWQFSVFTYFLFYVQELHLLFLFKKKERHHKVSPSKHISYHSHGGLQREASQSFTIQTLIILQPWALFGSTFLIIFRISSLVKQNIDSDSCVVFLKNVGRSLQVFITKNCFAKIVVNVSAIFLKSMIALFSCSNGGKPVRFWTGREI